MQLMSKYSKWFHGMGFKPYRVSLPRTVIFIALKIMMKIFQLPFGNDGAIWTPSCFRILNQTETFRSHFLHIAAWVNRCRKTCLISLALVFPTCGVVLLWRGVWNMSTTMLKMRFTYWTNWRTDLSFPMIWYLVVSLSIRCHGRMDNRFAFYYSCSSSIRDVSCFTVMVAHVYILKNRLPTYGAAQSSIKEHAHRLYTMLLT